jgi:hypothetical protein
MEEVRGGLVEYTPDTSFADTEYPQMSTKKR